MHGVEQGPRPDLEEEEIGLTNGAEKHSDAAITEIAETIRNECAHVYDDPDNGEKLDQLISDAEEFAEVDPRGWQELLRATKQKLSGEDEPKAIEDILRAALTKGATELM